jgi:hypothetical protein
MMKIKKEHSKIEKNMRRTLSQNDEEKIKIWSLLLRLHHKRTNSVADAAFIIIAISVLSTFASTTRNNRQQHCSLLLCKSSCSLSVMIVINLYLQSIREEVLIELCIPTVTSLSLAFLNLKIS